MPIQEDIKRRRAGEDGDESAAEETAEETDTSALAESSKAEAEGGEDTAEEAEHADAAAAAPSQLGAKRFVYAAYFAGGIGIAFIFSKALSLGWYRLQTWKPAIGEPRDEIIMPLAGLIGVGAALYYWYRTRARQLAEEVAAEMSKVTWPSRTEVQNGTFVVIVTTVVSTVFFALMDKFWGFVTNLVYGGT
jgi:preprotein translocase subunit SecE